MSGVEGEGEAISGAEPLTTTEAAMTDTTVLMADMAVLAGIFLLGFLAKMFPRNGRKAKQ